MIGVGCMVVGPVVQLSSLSCIGYLFFFFFSSRRRHTRFDCDWSSDVCSSDLYIYNLSLPYFPFFSCLSFSSIITWHTRVSVSTIPWIFWYPASIVRNG